MPAECPGGQSRLLQSESLLAASANRPPQSVGALAPPAPRFLSWLARARPQTAVQRASKIFLEARRIRPPSAQRQPQRLQEHHQSRHRWGPPPLAVLPYRNYWIFLLNKSFPKRAGGAHPG